MNALVYVDIDQGIHKGKFWSVSLEHFVERKPLFSEECLQKCCAAREWPTVHCGLFQVLFVVVALQLQKVSYFLYFTLVFFYLLSSLSKAGGTRHHHSGLDFQKYPANLQGHL